ncbi:hypothetical protein QVD17_15845 [Tagetes erecta]|uniref:Dynein light chain n=1 Tax=Tagetes erecta TaxID=13708 RepID=A0AAD8KQD9_TARER|nr:hypothetical protein QVD17_15845 [Tagetes erecta]
MPHTTITTTNNRHNYTPPDTPMADHPDPSITNISNHFSRLYLNHKARSSTQPQPQPTTVSDNSTTIAPCLTKSHSQKPKLFQKRPKPHYYYFNKPVKEQSDDEKDNIKRAIVVSNKVAAPQKQQDLEETNGFDEMKILPKWYCYDVEKQQSLSSMGMSRGRRRSFGSSSQAELTDFFACNGVKVVSADMPPYMQIHVVDVTRKTYDSLEKFTAKTLALTLKKEFDGVYGPAWHCIVGSSFGSFVTHSVGGFMYFSMDHKIYVLLFKTAVQKAH